MFFLQKSFRSNSSPLHSLKVALPAPCTGELAARYLRKEKRMRTCLFLILASIFVYALGGAQAASPEAPQEGQVCTDRTIKGSYGFTFFGARPASPVPGAPIVEGRGVGIRIFDGEGNFTEVASVKGVNTPAVIDRPNAGTYRVNPDCTGTAFLTTAGGAEFRFVVVDKGKEIFFTLIHPIEPMTLTHAVRIR
jgi:hypothetical protein